MAGNKRFEAIKAEGGAPRTTARKKIRQEESATYSTYATVAKVSMEREEIVLLFGLDRPTKAPYKETTVQITDRIILSPWTAKRLSALLHQAMRDYETAHGSLEVKASPPELPDRPAQYFPMGEKTPEKGRLLFQLTNNLDTPVGFERSFKMFEKTLLTNRFLLGFKKDAVRDTPHEKILSICENIDMPKALLEAFERHLPGADYIHFGFEEDQRTCIYKAYLEFYEKLERETGTRPDAYNPLLLHLGFKWDVSDNTRKIQTNYNWYPSLSVEEMVIRISEILGPYRNKPSFDAAKGILETVSPGMPHNDILYLEVTEEGSSRKSFDINIYRAGLQVCELFPFILMLFRHYNVPPDKARNLYDSVKTQVFGHLSGGIDREGRDFFTVYYGAESKTVFGTGPGLYTTGAPLTARACREIAHRTAPPFAGVEQTDKKAGMLFELVNNLGVRVGFERSFKLLRNTFLSDRFLMGFQRKNIQKDARGSILNICRELGMPDDFLKIFQEYLPESNVVLFGFEGGENKRLYKAYLEFGHRIAAALKNHPDSREPFVIHLAFKWDASNSSQKSMAKYFCFPHFSTEDMRERLSRVFYDRKDKKPFELIQDILTLAVSRAAPDAFLYFEAEEDNNPRRSFDINLYTADLRLNELYPFLLKMCQHFAIPLEKFHRLYFPLKTQIFGHLSGGVDREGRNFLTVYFGEKGISRR